MADPAPVFCPVHGRRTQDGHTRHICNAMVGRITEGRFVGWPILCGARCSDRPTDVERRASRGAIVSTFFAFFATLCTILAFFVGPAWATAIFAAEDVALIALAIAFERHRRAG